jgi:hypothetical protein
MSDRMLSQISDAGDQEARRGATRRHNEQTEEKARTCCRGV